MLNARGHLISVEGLSPVDTAILCATTEILNAFPAGNSARLACAVIRRCKLEPLRSALDSLISARDNWLDAQQRNLQCLLNICNATAVGRYPSDVVALAETKEPTKSFQVIFDTESAAFAALVKAYAASAQKQRAASPGTDANSPATAAAAAPVSGAVSGAVTSADREIVSHISSLAEFIEDCTTIVGVYTALQVCASARNYIGCETYAFDVPLAQDLPFYTAARASLTASADLRASPHTDSLWSNAEDAFLRFCQELLIYVSGIIYAQNCTWQIPDSVDDAEEPEPKRVCTTRADTPDV